MLVDDAMPMRGVFIVQLRKVTDAQMCKIKSENTSFIHQQFPAVQNFNTI